LTFNDIPIQITNMMLLYITQFKTPKTNVKSRNDRKSRA